MYLKINIICLIVLGIPALKAATPCDADSRSTSTGLTQCLDGIRADLKDADSYWFGTSYSTNCPAGTQVTVDCLNQNPTAQTIISRTIASDSYDESLIVNFVPVYLKETPLEYEACGHTYSHTTTAEHYLDPVETERLTPIQSRQMSVGEVQPALDSTKQYTFIAFDPGFNFFHAFYINIPGNDFTSLGTAVLEFRGPLYYLTGNSGNPYVFMLFEQTETDISVETLPTVMFDLSGVMTTYGLVGPVAVNKALINGDVYGAQGTYDLGVLNICPDYITEAATSTYNIPHVPSGSDFEVSVDTSFNSAAIDFETCCNSYSYQDETLSLDPIGNKELLPVNVRTQPGTIDLVKRSLLQMARTFTANYTLVMFDPDLSNAAIATEEKPFLHWLVTDIQNGDVTSGMTNVSYMAPAPPTGETHRYVFLLYKQTGAVVTTGFTPTCMVPGVENRCQFEIDRFVTDNSLELSGATWFRAGSDPYLAYMRIQAQQQTPDQACTGIEGYENPCPEEENGATTPTISALSCVSFALLTLSLLV